MVFLFWYDEPMTLEELQSRAVEIRDKYDNLNQAKRGQQLMAGFVGDVGDLSKIIMAKHGLRDMDDVDAKLAHELSDCLWSILVLASKYNVDMVSEFNNTMSELDSRINSEMAA
jgi:NTP pyrophosphatase (non-canonical NTP hydrolase)